MKLPATIDAHRGGRGNYCLLMVCFYGKSIFMHQLLYIILVNQLYVVCRKSLSPKNSLPAYWQDWSLLRLRYEWALPL